ncbi:MAG: hypothetical protein KC917_05640 [Candidatus Omnitrophica bacterium]|nr:hypothetical protein [Candidatus Omnitrophota bacterium]MCB9783199.1 hypothetical protein [Candidatus Omnitrophota bacterium]
MKKREILVNSGLLIGSLLLTALLVEVGFAWFSTPLYRRDRYQHYFDVFQWNRERILFDPVLGFINRPDLDIPFENVEFSTHVQTNSWGFRDDEESLENPEVLLFGDSFGFGWGVEREETAESLLEKETGKKVLNMSVSGYGTLQEFLLLQRFCEVEEATGCEVVILYYLNDRYENRCPPGGMFPAMVKHQGKIRITEADEEALWDCVRANKQQPYTYLCRRSAILDLILSRFFSPRKHWADRMAIQFMGYREKNGAGAQEGLDEFKILEYTTRFLLQLCHERNMNLRFVFLPFYGYYLGDLPKPYQEEVAILERLEVPFINPYEDFSAANYYDLDGHFNASGHRELASILTDFLGSEPNDKEEPAEP